MLGSFTRKLAHFTQCYLMCSNLVVFTSGIIFPFYLMPKWFALSSRIFSPVPNIAPALKAINLKGVGLDAVWPQFAGTICYTLFWLIVGGALYCWSVKRERKRLQKAEG